MWLIAEAVQVGNRFGFEVSETLAGYRQYVLARWAKPALGQVRPRRVPLYDCSSSRRKNDEALSVCTAQRCTDGMVI